MNVEFEERQFDEFVRLTDEVVQKAVDFVRNGLRKVWRREDTAGTALAFVNDAGAC